MCGVGTANRESRRGISYALIGHDRDCACPGHFSESPDVLIVDRLLNRTHVKILKSMTELDRLSGCICAVRIDGNPKGRPDTGAKLTNAFDIFSHAGADLNLKVFVSV